MEKPRPSLTLERKKALASAESRKIPIYYKHTVCSLLYAQNHKRQYPFDKTKLQRRSSDKHVTHTKSMSTKMKATNSSTKEICLTKLKDVGKPHSLRKLRNSVDITVTKGLGSKTVVAKKKSRLSDNLSSSRDEHNILIHEEEYKINPIENSKILVLDDCDKQHMDVEDADLLLNEMEDEDGGNISLCEPLVPTGLGGDEDMSESNTCSQGNNTCDVSSDFDQEKQETEIVTQDVDIGAKGTRHLITKDLENEEIKHKELEHGEPMSKVLEMKEGDEEIPIEEDLISKVVVKNQHVVTNGKKDTATYTNAIEGAESELRQQRSSRVKALVGAFENVISSESQVLQKRSFHFK